MLKMSDGMPTTTVRTGVVWDVVPWEEVGKRWSPLVGWESLCHGGSFGSYCNDCYFLCL